MDLTGIGGGAGGAFGAPAPDAFSSLGTEQFVKIIFTELSQQDPLQPNDSKALLEQLSSLRNIQSSIDLTNRLDALVAQNEMAAASGLIGRQISGIDERNTRSEGVVSSVLRTQDGAVLKLASGALIRMSNVDQVLQSPASGGSGGGGSSGGGGGTSGAPTS